MIELLTIGDEILSGATVNSNASFIGKALFEKGYTLSRETTLPDTPEPLAEGFREALGRSQVVIAMGGLGPTADDHTRRVVADLFSCPLQLNQEVADHLRTQFGPDLPTLNDQATIPAKATPLLNDVGTAPGLFFHEGGKIVLLLPGVPEELRPMFLEQGLPLIEKHIPIKKKKFQRAITLYGFVEADITGFLEGLAQAHPKVAIGSYPSSRIIVLRFTVEGTDRDEADRLIAPLLQKVQETYPDNSLPTPFSSIEEVIREKMVEKNLTLSTAESCTGGAIASTLTSVPGSSDYFLGSVVSYSNKIKTDLLAVPADLIAKHGAVSREVVEAMHRGILRLTGSDYAIAVTGIAGPSGGSPTKPVGTIWLAVGSPSSPSIWKAHLHGDRHGIIASTVQAALIELLTTFIR